MVCFSLWSAYAWCPQGFAQTIGMKSGPGCSTTSSTDCFWPVSVPSFYLSTVPRVGRVTRGLDRHFRIAYWRQRISLLVREGNPNPVICFTRAADLEIFRKNNGLFSSLKSSSKETLYRLLGIVDVVKWVPSLHSHRWDLRLQISPQEAKFLQELESSLAIGLFLSTVGH